MAREAERLTDQLEECNANTLAQSEMNSKLESKAHEMRRDKEEFSISWDATILKLKKKHQVC